MQSSCSPAGSVWSDPEPAVASVEHHTSTNRAVSTRRRASVAEILRARRSPRTFTGTHAADADNDRRVAVLGEDRVASPMLTLADFRSGVCTKDGRAGTATILCQNLHQSRLSNVAKHSPAIQLCLATLGLLYVAFALSPKRPHAHNFYVVFPSR
jgi:hypothetical protein